MSRLVSWSRLDRCISNNNTFYTSVCVNSALHSTQCEYTSESTAHFQIDWLSKVRLEWKSNAYPIRIQGMTYDLPFHSVSLSLILFQQIVMKINWTLLSPCYKSGLCYYYYYLSLWFVVNEYAFHAFWHWSHWNVASMK